MNASYPPPGDIGPNYWDITHPRASFPRPQAGSFTQTRPPMPQAPARFTQTWEPVPSASWPQVRQPGQAPVQGWYGPGPVQAPAPRLLPDEWQSMVRRDNGEGLVIVLALIFIAVMLWQLLQLARVRWQQR